MLDFTPSSMSDPAAGRPRAGWARNGWRALLICAAVVIVAVRTLSIYTESANWDEFNLLHNGAWTFQSGELHAGGRPGLAIVAVLPFVADCSSEIDVVRRVRVLWMFFTLAGLVGFALLLRQLDPTSPQRNVDALLGVALLALVPDFLVWSIQVRADQPAIAAAMWGGVALLASRTRPGWTTVMAGLAFGLGTLSSQKAVYLVALFGLLAAADVWRRHERQFTRDALRVVVCLSAMGLVVVGFYALAPQVFDGGPAAPSIAEPVRTFGAEAAGRQIRFQMSVFDYYRATIGYSQYVEMLPTLVPHMFFLALMVIASVASVARRQVLPHSLMVAWAVCGLGLTVGLFHAGAFRYFWMTLGVFPAVAFVLAREPVEALLESWGRPVRRGAVALFWCLLVGQAFVQSATLLRDTQAVQRETFDFARRNFERDEAGFHAEAGFFCSDDADRFPPYFSQLIERQFAADSGCAQCAPRLIHKFEHEQVKYVVASFRLTQFPPLVQTFWQENYLPYSGALLVAGKFLRAERDEGRVDLVVDGDYLWLPNEPPADVSIDGRLIRTGERVQLERGGHEVRFPKSTTRGMLVLAMDGPPKLPLRPFYRDF